MSFAVPTGNTLAWRVIYVFAVLVGLASGLSSGLFGVGGGMVMVPAMVLLLGADLKRAVGTSLAVIVPTTLVSAWKHHSYGNIDWSLAAKLIPMAIAGGWLGAWLTSELPTGALKKGFAVLLVAVGIYLFFSDRVLKPGARAAVTTPTAGPVR